MNAMTPQSGQVLEIRLHSDGQIGALIECPPEMLPSPGQYVQAHSLDNPDEVAPVSLFPSDFPSHSAVAKAAFVAGPPIPPSWQPGTVLYLRAPLGRGFAPQGSVKRLALAAIGISAARLLPLLDADAETALFTDNLPDSIPVEVEVSPLSALPDALGWPDFLAMDCPLERLPALPGLLGLEANSAPPCPTQILISTPMPCGALAECGVCAVPAVRGYKLACKDGPVFDRGEIRF